MPNSGFDKLVKIMPRRQLVIPCLVGAIGTGAVTGLVLGIVGPAASDQTATAFKPATTASPTATNTPTATATASPSASPSATATVKVVTGAPDAPPGAFIHQPWNDSTMEFATLQDVQRDDNGVVTVQVLRGSLLRGDSARRYLAAQGQAPSDFAVTNQASSPVQYTLRDDAAIFSQFDLGDHTTVNTTQLDQNQFYDAARTALDYGAHPAIWLRHSYGIDSAPVIYLAEQYLPGQ